MKKFISLAMAWALITLPCLTNSYLAAQEQAESEATVVDSEAEIRQSIGSYVTAFNQGDAKSLAAHWNKGGGYTTSDGKKLQGRQELENDFAAFFQDLKGAKLELPETNITFVSPNVAFESGIARVLIPEQEPSETNYEAVHVKTSAGWKIDSISEQDSPVSPTSHHQQLQSLAWMIGSWVDSDENSSTETTCHWTANQNFIVRSFKISINGSVDFEGTQVIGWDPQISAIRSWLFDSDGGFGVGQWAKTDNHWTVRTLNVLPDGRRGSSTNIYDLVDENTWKFRSIGRQIDGELLPNIAPVTISRVNE